jgi:hypothetical protein
MADDGSVWVKVYPEFAPGLEGVGDWNDVTSVTGASGNRYTYTADGTNWVAYEFTDDGTLQTSGGLLDLLVIGGGAKENNDRGMPGNVAHGVEEIPSGNHNITIGAGAGVHNYPGSPTNLGDLLLYGGGTYPSVSITADTFPGVYSKIQGPTEGKWFACGSLSPNKQGNAGDSGNSVLNGQNGIAIVRVPANHALATIPNTWGDL